MNKVFGAFLLGAVLILPAGSAQAGWFGFDDKPKETKPVAAAKKVVSTVKTAAPAIQVKPVRSVQPVPVQSVVSGQVQSGTDPKGRFFDLANDSTAVKTKAKAKGTPGEAVRASQDETERVKKEMLRLKQNMESAQSVRNLPKVPHLEAGSFKPPVIPSKSTYVSPAVPKGETGLPSGEVPRK